MTTTKTTPSEPTGTLHIRVWSKRDVLYRHKCTEFSLPDLIHEMKDHGWGGLTEEDFDTSHMKTVFDNVQDVYLLRRI